MIVPIVPGALEQGDVIFVLWPEWMLRQFIVDELELDTSGERPVWEITMLPMYGPDSEIRQTILRGNDEIMFRLAEQPSHTDGMRGHKDIRAATIPGQETKGKGTLEE